jgi:hypothetical protein
MAASFQFYQTTGGAPGTDTPQGTGQGSNDWDFKSNGNPGPSSGASDAITAGDFSYHVYTKVKFDQPATGTPFSSITNVTFYASDLNVSGYGSDAYILASGTDSYVEPSATSQSGTWPLVGSGTGDGADISTVALAGGTAGFTNWVGLQLKTAASGAVPGYGSYTSFTVAWDEI